MGDFYWKMFRENIPTLVSKGEIGVEFVLIPIFVVLCIATAFLILKGYTKARRVIQSLSLLILGFVFIQCLCITKQVVWGIKDLFKGNISLALAIAWFPLIIAIFVLFLGRRFYCSWMCPVGFLQDLTAKANIRKRSKRLRQVILVVLLIAIGLIMWITRPSPVLMGAGAWLGLLTIIVSILAISYPQKERYFGKLKYAILVGWAVLGTVMFVPGPWCVPAQAILKYSASISFVCVLLASMVVPRAWCRYICPDGGLLQLVSRKVRRKSGKEEKHGFETN